MVDLAGAVLVAGGLPPNAPEESWARDTAADVARIARSINRCRACRWVTLEFMASRTPSPDPSVEPRHPLQAALLRWDTPTIRSRWGVS